MDDDSAGRGEATPDDTERDLLGRARAAAEAAYAPYSDYDVGAALLTADGTVYTGCNIENANYTNSQHAEGVAIAEAIKEGHREFDRIVVTSGARDGVTPCGLCRQTLAEFCEESFVVICDEGDDDEGTPRLTRYTLGELLPAAISMDTLDAARE